MITVFLFPLEDIKKLVHLILLKRNALMEGAKGQGRVLLSPESFRDTCLGPTFGDSTAWKFCRTC
jgi:hypothetical protein